jgi:hypothetical protein
VVDQPPCVLILETFMGDDQFKQGNEHAVEALKQILTLASAILAVTITFLKDVLGAAAADAHLSFLVPTSWIFLVLAIWFAYVAIADSAKTLGASHTTRYVFAKGTMTGRLAFLAQCCFLLGLTLLTIFAVRNFGIGLDSKRQEPTSKTSTTPASTPTVSQRPDGSASADSLSLVDLSFVSPFPSWTQIRR